MTLAPEQKNEIIRRYTDGENVRDLAAAFSIAVQTVYNILRRRKVVIRSIKKRENVASAIEAVNRGIVSLVNAARNIDVSSSTLTRAVRERRRQGEQIAIRKGRPTHVSFIGDAAAMRLRWLPFPYPKMLTTEEATLEFTKLRERTIGLKDSEIRPLSPIGLKLCAPFFPNRFAATAKGNISAFDAWHSDVEMIKAVKFQRDQGDPVTPSRILRVVTLRCRTPTIFRPAIAKFICERYSNGGRVWDPCAGYGGRLLGAIAANVEYIGTDVDAATVDGNNRLAQTVGGHAIVHLARAEQFDLLGSVDLVFTSPPYFDRERYSDDEKQSWKQHGTSLDAWIDGFLRPVIGRAFDILNRGGYLVLNVADLRERGAVLPIVSRTIDVALKSGFHHLETLLMPLASINRLRASEPILVFQKPR